MRRSARLSERGGRGQLRIRVRRCQFSLHRPRSERHENLLLSSHEVSMRRAGGLSEWGRREKLSGEKGLRARHEVRATLRHLFGRQTGVRLSERVPVGQGRIHVSVFFAIFLSTP